MHIRTLIFQLRYLTKTKIYQCWVLGTLQEISRLPGSSEFSTGGYIILYQNGILSSEEQPPATNVRVIEFALSSLMKINIQNKTGSEFTRGQDTYDKMNSGKAKTFYWFNYGKHFMARAEITRCRSG